MSSEMSNQDRAEGVKLLPCPFCGEPGLMKFRRPGLWSEASERGDPPHWEVHCPEKHVRMYGKTEAEAAAAWNARKVAPQAPGGDTPGGTEESRVTPVMWKELGRAEGIADRALETSRRQSAVLLLTKFGYKWDGQEWTKHPAESSGGDAVELAVAAERNRKVRLANIQGRIQAHAERAGELANRADTRDLHSALQFLSECLHRDVSLIAAIASGGECGGGANGLGG